jgi:hypothetical protein
MLPVEKDHGRRQGRKADAVEVICGRGGVMAERFGEPGLVHAAAPQKTPVNKGEASNRYGPPLEGGNRRLGEKKSR